MLSLLETLLVVATKVTKKQLTQNINSREPSGAEHSLHELRDDEADVGVGEVSDEAEPARVEGVEDERGAPAPAVRDVARDGHGGQHAHGADGADQGPSPVVACQIELRNNEMEIIK